MSNTKEVSVPFGLVPDTVLIAAVITVPGNSKVDTAVLSVSYLKFLVAYILFPPVETTVELPLTVGAVVIVTVNLSISMLAIAVCTLLISVRGVPNN